MQTLTQKVMDDGFYEQEEDVLSYALFPEVSVNYFKWRKAAHSDVILQAKVFQYLIRYRIPFPSTLQ